MSLIVMLTFVTSLVVPVWFLVIVLAACGAMLWGWLSARKNYQDDSAVQKLVLQFIKDAYAEEAKEAEMLRQAHKKTIYALQDQLRKLEYIVRDTDEGLEQQERDICEEYGEEYEMPDPLEGAEKFALEITFLYNVLSAIHSDLYEKRISDPDMECYQNWVTSLQRQITSWDERRRALLQLEDLLRRLNMLEKMLHLAHGVETSSPLPHTTIPERSHQRLFDYTVVLRDFLELKLKSKTADLVKEAAQFTLEVEYLERQHEALDGALTVSYEKTHLNLKQVLLGAWDDVIAYAFESSPAFLVPYHQESLTKYEDEYARAMTLLAVHGECGQCGAVEHLIASMKHWGFWRALSVAMNEDRSADLVRGAYDQFLLDIELKIPRCLQELKQVMDEPFVFDDEIASFV